MDKKVAVSAVKKKKNGMGAETAILIWEVKKGLTITLSKQRDIWVKPE